MKIGLFFGSFNPIHLGHMVVAGYMLEFTGFDQLWFVVSPLNPLKKQNDLVSDLHRLKMVQLAVEEFSSRIKVCDIEMSMPLPSYTIDTINLLKTKYPEHNFSIILGSDSMDSITLWKDYEKLLSNNHLLIYPRMGSDLVAIKNKYSVDVINAPIVDISSTFIRGLISQGKDIRYFVPPSVAHYIKRNNIY